MYSHQAACKYSGGVAVYVLLKRPKLRARRFVTTAPLWFQAYLLGAGLFIVYLVTGNFRSGEQVSDIVATALPAWQLAQHGTFHLDGFQQLVWVIHRDGHWVSNRFPGSVLLGVPFYFLLGVPDRVTVYPSVVAAALVTAAAMAVSYVALCRWTSRRLALGAVLVLALATATWTVSADALWTHGLAQLCLASAMLLYARTNSAGAGLALGLTVLVRPHLAVVAGVLILWKLRHRRGKAAALMTVTFLVGVASLLVYNHEVFGVWNIAGGYHQHANDGVNSGPAAFPMNVVGTLISPERGIVVLMPFVLFLVPGLRAAWRRAPEAVRALSVAGLVYLLVQLYLNRFSGGDGFYGNRLVLETSTLALPLMALAYDAWTSRTWDRRVVFGVLVGFSFVTHAYAAVVSWLPSGGHFPWGTYLLIDIVRYTGPVPALVWFGASLITGVLLIRRSARRRSLTEQSLEAQSNRTPAPVGLNP